MADNGGIPERYARNLQALNQQEQRRLLGRKVVLVGLGGLGGYLLDMLLRIGVGRIEAFDGDLFEEGNLNRQALSKVWNVGRHKAEAALQRALEVNPSVKFTAHSRHAKPEDLEGALVDADLLLDALGELSPRRMLARAAAGSGLPLVTAAVAGWTGWVCTVLPGGPEPAELMAGGDDAQAALGCPAPAVAAVAAMECSEATAILAGREPSLAGRMLVMDLERMYFQTMDLSD